MTNTLRAARDWYPLRVLLVALAPIVLIWAAIMLRAQMEVPSAIAALALVVVPVALVSLSSSEAAAEKWAEERGARFDPAGVDQLRRHLVRTRVARTLGVTAGLATNLMLVARYNADPDGFAWFLDADVDRWTIWLAGLGYVTGSLWAEATKPRDRIGEAPGTAVLSPRRLGDYLDRNVRWFLGAFAAAAALVTTVWLVAPLQEVTGEWGGFPWVRVLAPVAVAAVSLALAWWTCRRPERTRDNAALAYEELTRTATANALTGAAIAMLGEYSSQLLGAPRGGEPLSYWFSQAGGLLALLGLAVWISSGTKLMFRNRRIDALRAAA